SISRSNLVPSIARPRLPQHHSVRVPQSRYLQRIFVTRIGGRFDFNGEMLGRGPAGFIPEIAHEIDLETQSTAPELGRFQGWITSIRTAIELAVFGQGSAKVGHRPLVMFPRRPSLTSELNTLESSKRAFSASTNCLTTFVSRLSDAV